jgi:hypothetical protein
MRAALFVAAAWPSILLGHGGQPAQAVLLTPDTLGPTVSDTFMLEWLDAGPPPPLTGSALVSFYYAAEVPPTFPLGSIPPTLTGTAIVTGLLEESEPNELAWDVSSIPSGHYWLYSRVDDPPAEMSAQYIRISTVPLSILHPGEDLGPAVAITRPQSEFASGDETYNIEYQSYDTTGTARITFEAAAEIFGREPRWITVADNIRAQREGAIVWETIGLAEGDWVLRATITDCMGRTHRAYARYFVFLTHLDPIDAGTSDSGPYDAGSLEDWCASLDRMDAAPTDANTPDASVADAVAPPPPPSDGCGCRASTSAASPWLPLLALLLALRSRSARPSRKR